MDEFILQLFHLVAILNPKAILGDGLLNGSCCIVAHLVVGMSKPLWN